MALPPTQQPRITLATAIPTWLRGTLFGPRVSGRRLTSTRRTTSRHLRRPGTLPGPGPGAGCPIITGGETKARLSAVVAGQLIERGLAVTVVGPALGRRVIGAQLAPTPADAETATTDPVALQVIRCGPVYDGPALDLLTARTSPHTIVILVGAVPPGHWSSRWRSARLGADIGGRVGQAHRDRHAHPGASAGRGPGGQRAAERARPFRHAHDAEVTLARAARASRGSP